MSEVYANMMLNSNRIWREFAGNSFLVGIKMNLSFEEIQNYVFETYHLSDISEIPANHKEVLEDMTLYFE